MADQTSRLTPWYPGPLCRNASLPRSLTLAGFAQDGRTDAVTDNDPNGLRGPGRTYTSTPTVYPA